MWILEGGFGDEDVFGIVEDEGGRVTGGVVVIITGEEGEAVVVMMADKYCAVREMVFRKKTV